MCYLGASISCDAPWGESFYWWSTRCHITFYAIAVLEFMRNTKSKWGRATSIHFNFLLATSSNATWWCLIKSFGEEKRLASCERSIALHFPDRIFIANNLQIQYLSNVMFNKCGMCCVERGSLLFSPFFPHTIFTSIIPTHSFFLPWGKLEVCLIGCCYLLNQLTWICWSKYTS